MAKSASPASVLARLDLSPVERDMVNRFESDCKGRSFLAVADILRERGYVDECVELLHAGVRYHPTFAAARVALARELYRKGLIAEAWKQLGDTSLPLRDNVAAQRLIFRLANLLGFFDVARATYDHLSTSNMLDESTKLLGSLLNISGPEAVQTHLRSELTGLGVETETPESGWNDTSAAATKEALAQEKASRGRGTGGKGDLGGLRGTIRAAEAFVVVALPDVLVPVTAARSPNARDTLIGGSGRDAAEDESPDSVATGVTARGASKGARDRDRPTLDSLTLAEIWEGQGHIREALAMCRRLLVLSPGDERLVKKIRELERSGQPLTTSPASSGNRPADGHSSGGKKAAALRAVDDETALYRRILARLENSP